MLVVLLWNELMIFIYKKVEQKNNIKCRFQILIYFREYLSRSKIIKYWLSLKRFYKWNCKKTVYNEFVLKRRDFFWVGKTNDAFRNFNWSKRTSQKREINNKTFHTIYLTDVNGSLDSSPPPLFSSLFSESII